MRRGPHAQRPFLLFSQASVKNQFLFFQDIMPQHRENGDNDDGWRQFVLLPRRRKTTSSYKKTSEKAKHKTCSVVEEDVVVVVVVVVVTMKQVVTGRGVTRIP
jgi:hypothetical protein